MGGGKEMRQVSKGEEEHIINETEHEELTMPTIPESQSNTCFIGSDLSLQNHCSYVAMAMTTA